MEAKTDLSHPIEYVRQNSDIIGEALNQYGYIVIDSLYFIVIGMLSVFVLHKLASRFLYPYLPNARLARVVLARSTFWCWSSRR